MRHPEMEFTLILERIYDHTLKWSDKFFVFSFSKQDGSISIGGRSSLGESDSENDGFSQRQAETAGPSSTSPSALAGATSAPQRRLIKAIKEESHRQTLAAFPKSQLTLTDTRSTNRHSTIVGDKALHRFQQNRVFKKDPSIIASASSSVVPDTFLRSRSELECGWFLSLFVKHLH